jgi:Ca-activated chloride channel family protein
MPRFEWPWALIALAVLPLLVWQLRRRRRAAILFPGLLDRTQLPQSLRLRFVHLPSGLRFLALALLIVAIAGPLWRARIERQITSSIGIQILLDRSSSMGGRDMIYNGREGSRLDAVKRVSEEFIFGNGHELQGRPADMIGMIAFAADPITLFPLTLTHDELRPALRSLNVVQGADDGTAIGDAIALAAARFELLDNKSRLKSKVIVLITDGENNQGTHTLQDADALARQWGVRIYAIGIRPAAIGTAGSLHGDPEGEVAGDLEMLAAATGGVSRIARDSSGLQSIYAEIDRLERSEVSAPRVKNGNEASSWIAVASLAILLLELALRQTWLQRIP